MNGYRRIALAFGGNWVLAVALSVGLAGCTSWVKPGADPAALDAALTHCRAVAYSQMPSNMVTVSGTGASYSDRKTCNKNSLYGCVKKYGTWYAVTTSTSDTNSDGRRAIVRDCMYQGGWREE